MTSTESLLSKKYRRHKSCTHIPSQIGRDAICCESPDHDCVGETDREWCGDGRDEGVSRVEDGPDYDADEAVDEEFLEKEEALVCLVWVGEGAKDACCAAVEPEG
jgi:hypothetical protein